MKSGKASLSQPETLFRPIERETTLANRVAAELEELIVGGKIAAGQRLPSERELGDRFGVSRTVIREAVRALGAKGLLEVRMGDGTFVREATAQGAAESLTRLLRVTGVDGEGGADAVYEVRRLIEGEIAALAAARATPNELKALEQAVEALDLGRVSPEEYVEADVRFHRLLAEATHNGLFVALLESLSELLRALREVALAVPGARDQARKHHAAILAKVAARDAVGARKAMEIHMRMSEEILRKAVERGKSRTRSR